LSELLNLVGMSSGIALYAMLLAMVLRAGRVDPLLLTTAVLGLVWNVCALPAYELPKLGVPGPFPTLIAVGFSALGLLPAVVVHSVLRGERDQIRGVLGWSIVAVAYGVSAAAAILHARAAWAGDALPSVFGMRLLTYTFVALVVPLAVATRGQSGSRRALWAAALAIFAVSALHLSQFHQGDPSWPVELVGHHASLPLAFAILYQDFPFALADLFLKRAITLLALVTAAFVAFATVGARSSVSAAPFRGAREVGILITLWVATALLYPRLRALVAWFVDAVVLKRPDYASLRAEVGRQAQRHSDIPSMLDDACARLAPALSAAVVRWHEGVNPQTEHAVAVVDIPVAEPPRYWLEVGQLTGGRRLLSDDRAVLDAIAALLGRRIDAIRITRERYERQLREQEIGKLATEAELRALRSQINPHFLFNALTTIGYLIQTSPTRALDTLMRLTSLLRGVLRSEGELTTLGRELDLVEAYLDIERARFDERLRVRIEVSPALRTIRVPPLVLQPLVENAVKHGIAPERRGGEVVVTARIEHPHNAAPLLAVVVQDTGAGASAAALRHGRETGVGLKNVERRLVCQYGEEASLVLRSAPGRGTTVEIRLPAGLASPSEPAAVRMAP
jgi:signal transduction histidine kinase